MSAYKNLNKETLEKIKNRIGDRFILEDRAIRRKGQDKGTLWRPAFVRDAEKILHCPYYNRYGDKTQVFSLYKNDDITRRALHVQLVSRIARNIGRMLGLDTDLIEAIALGHDIGHTPFGHAGEKFLDIISMEKTGTHFLHNVQSVRVLDEIFCYNISLQTLDGILCHNGETEMMKYVPWTVNDFEEFDSIYKKCYMDKAYANSIMPSTLEGCVVRISDLIAYIGKDRQDAIKTGLIDSYSVFNNSTLGNFNAAIINNMVVNVIENSLDKDYIAMDEECYANLRDAKKENYDNIYYSEKVASLQKETLSPMFEKLYCKLLSDLNEGSSTSPIFTQHIDYINSARKYYCDVDYLETDKHRIVIDYIASMTDDYLVELYEYFFPGKSNVKYFAYFEE